MPSDDLIPMVAVALIAAIMLVIAVLAGRWPL
jgi:hypothetical protein